MLLRDLLRLLAVAAIATMPSVTAAEATAGRIITGSAAVTHTNYVDYDWLDMPRSIDDAVVLGEGEFDAADGSGALFSTRRLLEAGPKKLNRRRIALCNKCTFVRCNGPHRCTGYCRKHNVVLTCSNFIPAV